MAFADAVADVVTALAATTGIDRAYSEPPQSVNEPGTIAIVELESYNPYFTIDGVSHEAVLRVYVLKAPINADQAKADLLPVIAAVTTKFRSAAPTNADYWLLQPGAEVGDFERNNTIYYGFSQLLKLVGNF